MTIDACGFEPHFVDHSAPVWEALPPGLRGRYLVDAASQERAPAGAEVVDAQAHRGYPPPSANPGSGPMALATSIGDIKVMRRLGYRRFAFLEHGAGQSYDGRSALMASYAGGPDREDCELFLVPNEYSAARWRTAYPRARVEVVGCPRLDTLPAREVGPVTVAISFHGRWPTDNPYGGNALGDFLEQLPTVARRFQVIGHAHPGKGRQWQATMERLYRKAGIEFVADFDDVCRRADVYVCDNSSTIFEFAATGRPVVLMNAASWQRGHGPGLRFWDAATVGLNVWPGDDLADAIELGLEDRPTFRAEREAALDFVYAYRTGAAARAAAAIASWVESREAVAA